MATQIFFIVTPENSGNDFQFEEHIFQMGWNYQLVFWFLALGEMFFIRLEISEVDWDWYWKYISRIVVIYCICIYLQYPVLLTGLSGPFREWWISNIQYWMYPVWWLSSAAFVSISSWPARKGQIGKEAEARTPGHGTWFTSELFVLRNLWTVGYFGWIC